MLKVEFRKSVFRIEFFVIVHETARVSLIKIFLHVVREPDVKFRLLYVVKSWVY